MTAVVSETTRVAGGSDPFSEKGKRAAMIKRETLRWVSPLCFAFKKVDKARAICYNETIKNNRSF
jgi:hypothetical protein